MTDLMLENVNVLLTKEIHEVLPSDTLTPITTGSSLHTIGQPEGVIVVSLSASGAATVVTVLVEETAALLGTLGNALGVSVGVDIKTLSRTLEKALVLDSPSNDIDLDFFIWKVIVTGNPLHPSTIRVLERTGDFGALLSSHRSARLPANADVELALSSDDLVPAVVLEAECVAVGLDFVIPDFLEGCGEVGGRVPAGLALGGTVSGDRGP